MRLPALLLAILVPLSTPAWAARPAPTAVTRGPSSRVSIDKPKLVRAPKIALPAAAPRRFFLAPFSRTTKKDKAANTIGERMADKVATLAGSWKFIGTSTAIMAAWITYNAMSPHPFDAPPYVGLNLVLSTVAALQAPFILMSQNRQAAGDRLRLEADFEVNRHADREIAALHDKIDALSLHIDKLTTAMGTQAASSGPAHL